MSTKRQRNMFIFCDILNGHGYFVNTNDDKVLLRSINVMQRVNVNSQSTNSGATNFFREDPREYKYMYNQDHQVACYWYHINIMLLPKAASALHTIIYEWINE